MKTKTSINALHHQITDWLRETDFYKQELSILQKRLEEVASKNTSNDVLAKVEHFQNQFILNKEQLDIIVRNLNVEEGNVERKAEKLPEHIQQKFIISDGKLKDSIKKFSSEFADLRFEFNKFLNEVL